MKGSKDKGKQSSGIYPCSLFCAHVPLRPPFFLPPYSVQALEALGNVPSLAGLLGISRHTYMLSPFQDSDQVPSCCCNSLICPVIQVLVIVLVCNMGFTDPSWKQGCF